MAGIQIPLWPAGPQACLVGRSFFVAGCGIASVFPAAEWVGRSRWFPAKSHALCNACAILPGSFNAPPLCRLYCRAHFIPVPGTYAAPHSKAHAPSHPDIPAHAGSNRARLDARAYTLAHAFPDLAGLDALAHAGSQPFSAGSRAFAQPTPCNHAHPLAYSFPYGALDAHARTCAFTNAGTGAHASAHTAGRHHARCHSTVFLTACLAWLAPPCYNESSLHANL